MPFHLGSEVWSGTTGQAGALDGPPDKCMFWDAHAGAACRHVPRRAEFLRLRTGPDDVDIASAHLHVWLAAAYAPETHKANGSS